MGYVSRTLIVFLLFFFAISISAERQDSAISVYVGPADLLARPVGANWTSYNGDYSGQRFSTLNQINAQNVSQLRAAWVFHPGNSQRLEVTPVVIRGVMFLTSANDVFALDASTGRTLWHYSR